MRVLSNASPTDRVAARRNSTAGAGLRAGLVGGLAVAIFFGVLDVRRGQPLHTPSLLGQVIFLGTPAGQARGSDPAMALAYTALHLAVFVGIGSVAAYAVASFERRPPLGLLLLLLFVVFEAGLFTAAGAFAPELLRVLGTQQVAAANGLAALSMTAYFWWVHTHTRRGARVGDPG